MNASHLGHNVLITTSNWFYAPDGRSYRAVWGKLTAIKTAEDSLGVRPRGPSTNWYVEVGDTSIAGCQVMYCIRTDTVFFGPVAESSEHNGQFTSSERLGAIYNANGDQ